jgi:hypothetical protein
MTVERDRVWLNRPQTGNAQYAVRCNLRLQVHTVWVPVLSTGWVNTRFRMMKRVIAAYPEYAVHAAYPTRIHTTDWVGSRAVLSAC